MKNCRFCHNKSVELLYPASGQKTSVSPAEFACTNCGFGVHGPIVRCLKCKIIYVDADIKQSQISTYYEVAKDPEYFREQPARNKTFNRYLRKLEETCQERGKLLDIGTNTGLFVKLAQDAGWKAMGIEPNKWAVEYAKKNYNVDIINKPFEKNTFPKNSFDVVTMWDVIEHFTDPVEELSKVYGILKPGGVFAFTTVDPESQLAHLMGGKWSWYMEMHRVFFSRESAKLYLEKAGFKNIIFKPHFRFLSAGYLTTRLVAINTNLSAVSHKLITLCGLGKLMVPYYANDLYDCYAVK